MTSVTSRPSSRQPSRAIVIGGSLGGLFAGSMLRSIGWDVDIYERSAHDLDSRGGGIVLQPDVVEVFRRTGIDLDEMELGVDSEYRTVFRPDGAIQSKTFAPQTQTSWSLIYTTLKGVFGDEHYHQGKVLTRIQQDNARKKVTAYFDDGTSDTADLLIGADGGGSTVRGLLWPDAGPSYAGYLAWRGLVPENDMPSESRKGLHGDFGFANNKQSHILGYLVPGDDNDVRPGNRYYNWVWYRVADPETLNEILTDRNGHRRPYSIPEGLLAPIWHDKVNSDADELLPPAFRDLVHATENPFGQAIRDLAVDQMVDGRVILVGDAASIPRPHTAASTSKAAANALALAEALVAAHGNVDQALKLWEPRQVTVGKVLLQRGTDIGNHLLFRS